MSADHPNLRRADVTDDDVGERLACDHVGEPGHFLCGVCPRCNHPRFECGHPVYVPTEPVFHLDVAPDAATSVDPHAPSPFVTISAALDALRPADVSDGEQRWRRVTKVAEESGEVWAALSGYVGENPRKGQTHTLDDLLGELLDTASAALCAWAHLTGNDADPLPALLDHVAGTAERLRVATSEEEQ